MGTQVYIGVYRVYSITRVNVYTRYVIMSSNEEEAV